MLMIKEEISQPVKECDSEYFSVELLGADE